jgi:hypothetical protein
MIMAMMSQPVVAADDEGILPEWLEGFSWSYDLDADMNYKLFDIVTVEHIRDNLTRTVYKVMTVGDETLYKVWEEHRGTLSGEVEWQTFKIPVTAQMIGSGWSYIRANDMALINHSLNMTFMASNIPIIGSFSGGLDNYTTYDPPMPLMKYPVSTQTWRTRTTVNTTSELFMLYPFPGQTWDNSSEYWDLNSTASTLKKHTVPAGTYDAYEVTETGTVTTMAGTSPVQRSWFYADAAAAAIETWDGYQLAFTDAWYKIPNKPPIGPMDVVEMTTDEDLPLEIDLSLYFTDPEGDQLTYSLELLPGSDVNATLEGAGASRTLSPAANWTGVLQLSAVARDPQLASATGRIDVNVRPVNDAPIVVLSPWDITTDEDVPIRANFDLVDVFFDVDGDELTYTVDTTESVTAMVNGTYIDIVPYSDWWGSASVAVTAKDPGGETAFVQFQLFVTAVNDPPVIVGQHGPGAVHEASNGTFEVDVVDIDDEDLEYEWFLDRTKLTVTAQPSYNFYPLEVTGYQVTLAVTVTDDWGDFATTEWLVTILRSPRITAISPPDPVEALVGDTVTFTVEVEDADTPVPEISWTWRGSIIGTGSRLDLTYETDDVGEWSLELEVSDGVGIDERTWTVTVLVPNEPPEVTIFSPLDGQSYEMGDTVPLECDVTDEDLASVDVNWTVDGTPVGTGEVAEFLALYEGPVVIQVSVSDGEHRVTRTVTIEVHPPLKPHQQDEDNQLLAWTFLIVLLVLLVAGLTALWRVRMRDGPSD